MSPIHRLGTPRDPSNRRDTQLLASVSARVTTNASSLRLDSVCQPDRLIIDKFVEAVNSGDWTHLDAAVAYVVMGGVRLLEERLADSAVWPSLQKRWLVGIDWCRSQPLALQALEKLPRSQVRIVDGAVVVARPGCAPDRPFHPKGYLFRRVSNRVTTARGLLLGSGNLSYNGLRGGRELNYWVSASSTTTPEDQLVVASLDPVSAWFRRVWRDSTPYREISAAYDDNFSLHQTRPSAAVTDDDTAPPSLRTRRGLREADLVKLRSFDHLWIDTGSMYSNLGAGRPGNQLELKRFTRVFCGFPAADLPQNSYIGAVVMEYAGYLHPDRHLRYGDNGMDKLDLPVPGVGAPPDYRKQTLRFTREAGRGGRLRFILDLATSGAERQTWRANSRKIGGLFRMGGGSPREFGVY